MNKTLITIFCVMTLLACKKSSNEPQAELKNFNGKVDITNLQSSDIIISSEIDKSTLSNDGNFSLNSHSILLAKSKTTNNPIFFGFPGTDESSSYLLDAKETALYFTLSGLPHIRRLYYKQYIKKIKQAIYQYQEVKNLEIKIKQSIQQKGYLDYDLIGQEIGLAVDKILTTTKAEQSTYTAGRAVIDQTYAASGGFYRVSDEIATDWTDQFNTATSTYKLKRKMYNSTAAVVGVQIGKYNKADNSATIYGRYVGFIPPFYPPNLASVDGTIANLEQFYKATYDLATNGWDGLANTDAYSKSEEFIFDAKANSNDAVVFVNGYYDPQIMGGINIAYVFMDNLQDILKKVNNGNNLYSSDEFINNFFKSIVDDVSKATRIANYTVWLKQKDYDLITNDLTELLQEYLLTIKATSAVKEWEAIKDYVDESFKILTKGWISSLYKYSSKGYKIASALIISTSKKFRGIVPIEFDNLTLPLSPYQPSPFNVTLNNVASINFQWLIKNPQSQTLKYNIYLSNTINGLINNKIATDITSTNFNYTGSLVANTRYYWQVEVTNQFGEKRLGAIWTFDNGLISEITQGLVAYYPFNNNVSDLSNNGNNGSINGGVSFVQDRKGVTNSALFFNGLDGYVQIPSSTTLESPRNGITISAWIKAENVASNGAYFLCKTNTGNLEPFQYRVGFSNFNLYFGFKNSGNGTYDIQGPSYSLAENTWKFVTYTYDGLVAKFYIDGVKIGEIAYAGTINPDTKPLEIGRDAHGHIEWFKGTLDDIRIYYRPLSEIEINNLMNQ